MLDQISCLPTRFAIVMATSQQLYKEDDVEFPDKFTPHERLEVFQSVSITAKFEEALAAAYFGMEVNEKQVAILKTIHSLTAKWLVGKLSQTLLDRLDLIAGVSDKGKDVADISGKIMELIEVSGESNPTAQSSKRSRLLLEHTNVESITKNQGKAEA